jgi:hypothetical protein
MRHLVAGAGDEILLLLFCEKLKVKTFAGHMCAKNTHLESMYSPSNQFDKGCCRLLLIILSPNHLLALKMLNMNQE